MTKLPTNAPSVASLRPSLTLKSGMKLAGSRPVIRGISLAELCRSLKYWPTVPATCAPALIPFTWNRLRETPVVSIKKSIKALKNNRNVLKI